MRRLVPSFTALLVFAVAAAEPPKKPGKEAPLPEIDRKVLERLNAIRKQVGVEPVKMDAKLSDACGAHAKYVMKHFDHIMKTGTSPHGQDPNREGYSKAGSDAGKSSVIHYVEPLAGLDGWIASVYHRIGMLNADLQRVGLGYTTGTGNPPYVVCMDVLTGLPALGADRSKVVMYPVDRQADVPLEFGGERPNPIGDDKDGKAGFPITITFREIVKVTLATATLREKDGKEDLAIWLATPEKTPRPEESKLNSMWLLAQDPLKPATTYVVSASALLDGKTKWTKTWSFTTRK